MKRRVPCIRLWAAGWIALAASALTFAAPGSGTRHGGAELIWDEWGVPHIFAADASTGAHAFGWAQAQSHGELLLRYMAQSRGRGAEFYGPAYEPADRAVILLGLRHRAQAWYSQQPAAVRREWDAFAAGINDYARSDAANLSPVARSVLPVTGVDVLAHGVRTMYQFLSLESGCAAILSGGIQWATPGTAGSNGWAIGPAKSSSGHAMLLANPHLQWSGDFAFYEAQLSEPGYALYGTAIVGFPVLVIGFNENHGWTHTVNTLDACDAYALQATPEGYRYDGRKRRFEAHDEILKVRQTSGSLTDEVITVRRSELGPVVESHGALYAIRVAGLEVGSFAGMYAQWKAMGAATSLKAFQAALRRQQLPLFNVMYADRAGHIAGIFNGLVPRRARGTAAMWQAPVPGADPELVWHEVLPYAALPAVVDPPSGWVQNSNGPPWYLTQPFLDPVGFAPDLAPHPGAPGGSPSLRDRRGLRMLGAPGKLSFAELLADKYSTRSELADLLLDDLVAAGRASTDPDAVAAATVLAGWNRAMDPQSRGAELFAQWAVAMAGAKEGDPSVASTDQGFVEPFDPARPLATPHGLRNPAAASEALGRAVRAMREQGAAPDVAWGEVRRLQRGAFDLPANGGPDSLGVFRTLDFLPTSQGRQAAFMGDTFVAAVEFGAPLTARVFLSTGNSSDPSSPHYGDQLPLSSRAEWRIPWMTRESLAGHVESRVVFDRQGRISAR